MPTTLWSKIQKGIQGRVSKDIFETWFKPLKALGREGNTLRVQVPHSLYAEWIRSHYRGLLDEALRAAGEPALCLEFIEDSGGEGLVLAPPPSPKVRPTRPAPPLPERIGILDEKYRFNRFVVGPSNQFAHAAATAVAQQPSNSYNPLYIYGGTGLGKTHLVHSIGHFVRENFPALRVAYITAERFTNEMISSIGTKTTVAFRDKYRQLDLLLLDDIQFLNGKMGTQEELFHTFNALYEMKKQVVFSSDMHPRELQGMEERLRSRFEWGLIADIQPPELETRVAILFEKARDLGLTVPEDVALFVAGKVKSNIRELEGFLNRIHAWCNLKGLPLTMDSVRDALKGYAKEDGHAVSVETIQKHVAAHFKIKPKELLSKTNQRRIVFPRQVAMYLCKELTPCSLPEIGERFGGKHHSTVLHSIRKVDASMKEDPTFQQVILTLLHSFQ
jgi:chromosomal replication initiator protein